MGVSYYRDKFQQSVTEMARCPGGFGDRLFVAWVGCISTLNWKELEALIMYEDKKYFKKLESLFKNDLKIKIESYKKDSLFRAALEADEVSEEYVAKWVNAESVIKSMHGNAAKKYVEAIIQMYERLVSTADFEKLSSTAYAKSILND